MEDNKLYILLKNKKEKQILNELFQKKEIEFADDQDDLSVWKRHHRQQQIITRNSLEVDSKRSDWFLKHLHDKMNYMRS